MTGKFQMQSHITLISLCHLHRSLLRRRENRKKYIKKDIMCSSFTVILKYSNLKPAVPKKRCSDKKIVFQISSRKLHQTILEEF